MNFARTFFVLSIFVAALSFSHLGLAQNSSPESAEANPELKNLEVELGQLLGNIKGLEVKRLATKILLDGVIRSQKDWQKFRRVLNQYASKSDIMVDLVEYAQSIDVEIADDMEVKINEMVRPRDRIRVRVPASE